MVAILLSMLWMVTFITGAVAGWCVHDRLTRPSPPPSSSRTDYFTYSDEKHSAWEKQQAQNAALPGTDSGPWDDE